MIRPVKTSLASIGVCALLTLPAFAQTAPPPATPPRPPADIQKTLRQIDDLNLLVSILPLKLTTAQIDRLLEPLKAFHAGDADRQKKDIDSDYAAVRGVASDVDKSLTDGLKGTPTDPAAEAKINKALADIDARYAGERRGAIEPVAVVAREILTPEQRVAIDKQWPKLGDGPIKVPADIRRDNKKTMAYAQERTLSAFVERVLLPDRAVAVLEGLKKGMTAAPASASAPAAPPATTNPAQP